MTIFSVILVLIVSYSVCKHKNINKIFSGLLIILLSLSINSINIGYFCVFGGIALSYSDFLTICISICGIYIIYLDSCVDRKLLISSLQLICVVGLGLIMLIVNPSSEKIVNYVNNWDSYFRGNMSHLTQPSFSSQSVLQFARMLIFLFDLIIIKKVLNINDWVNITNKISKVSSMLILIYLIEVITVKIVHMDIYYNIRTLIFGGITEYDFDRLMGLSGEPSLYAVVLFFNLSINSILILYNRGKQENKTEKYRLIFSNIVYIILGIASTALTFWLLFFMYILLILYLNLDKELRNRIFLCGSIVLLVLLGLFYVFRFDIIVYCLGSTSDGLNRIGNLLKTVENFKMEKKIAYSSEGTRILSILMTIQAWKSRPILGLGIGSSRCFSGIFSIISCIGILGFIIWLKIIVKEIVNCKTDILFIILYLVPFLVSGDFDLFYNLNIVMWTYLAVIVFKNKVMWRDGNVKGY